MLMTNVSATPNKFTLIEQSIIYTVAIPVSHCTYTFILRLFKCVGIYILIKHLELATD